MNTEETYLNGIGSNFHLASEEGVYIKTERVGLIEINPYSLRRTWAEEQRRKLIFKLMCIKSNWNKLWFIIALIPVITIIFGICALFMIWSNSEINVIIWTFNGCYASYLAILVLWEEMNCDPNDCYATHKGKRAPYYYKYIKK